MKKLFLSVILFTIALFYFNNVQAQTPESINYQAVARDNGGIIMANQSVNVQIRILQGSTTGTSVCDETFSINTNDFGLINLQIGTQNPTAFAAIDWSTGPYYFEVSLNGTLFGTSQLVSVPYALHAATADSVSGFSETDPVFGASIAAGITGTDTMYWNNKLDVELDGDPTNEIELPATAVSGQVLTYDGSSWIAQNSGSGADNWGSQVAQVNPRLTGNGTAANPLDIASQGASNDEILKWNGSAWVPASDNNTTYTAGNQLSLSGTAFNVTEGSGSDLNADMVDGMHYTDIQTWVNANDNNTTYSAGNQLSLSGTTFSVNEGSGSDLDADLLDGMHYSDIQTWVNTNDDNTTYTAGTGLALTGTTFSNTGDLSTSNELQTLSIVGQNLTLSDGGGTIVLPDAVDDADADPLNEIQTLGISGHDITLSDGGGTITVPDDNTTYSAGTGIALTGTTFSNTGDLSASNELQTISISDHDITLSNGGGTITVPDNNTTYTAGNQLSLSGTTFNVSDGAGSGLDADLLDGMHYSDIQTWVNTNDDNTTYSAGTGLTLSGTTFNANFGTTAGTISEGNHTHTNMVTGVGSANHLAYWTGSSSISYDSGDLYYLAGVDRLYLGTNTGPAQFNISGQGDISLQYASNQTSSGDYMGSISFFDNYTTSAQAQISVERGSVGGSSDYPTDIIFSNTPDGSTTLTERMRIQHDGDIGIGTSSPGHPLHIYNDSKTWSMLIDHNTYSSSSYGLYVDMDGANTYMRGIYSNVNSTSTAGNTAYGFYADVNAGDGVATSADATGMYITVDADDNGYGVQSDSWANDRAYGVYASAYSGASARYGVYGYALSSATSSYAVYASGNLTCTGTKAATVRTDEGPKEVYSQESPEIWFEDFGSASVSNGKAIVNLQSDFVSTVTINDQHPIKVFITPNSDLGNWWVEKKGKTFILHAPTAANGSEFDYRVVAKRQGYEDYRMKDAPESYTDYNLYKNIEDVPEEYRETWVQNAPPEVKKNYPEYYDAPNDPEVE